MFLQWFIIWVFKYVFTVIYNLGVLTCFYSDLYFGVFNMFLQWFLTILVLINFSLLHVSRDPSVILIVRIVYVFLSNTNWYISTYLAKYTCKYVLDTNNIRTCSYMILTRQYHIWTRSYPIRTCSYMIVFSCIWPYFGNCFFALADHIISVCLLHKMTCS